MNSPRLPARSAAIRSVIAVLFLGFITASGGGCGQRGPLYLPEPEPAADGGAEAQRDVDEEESSGVTDPGDGTRSGSPG